MKYGYFDDVQREYVITRPDTPLPWINYLGLEALFGIISNTAGGYTFHQDARLRRLTRYRYNNVPADFGGRYLYLRDDVTGEFWSPSWQPTRTDLDEYECRHGMSYSPGEQSSRSASATTARALTSSPRRVATGWRTCAHARAPWARSCPSRRRRAKRASASPFPFEPAPPARTTPAAPPATAGGMPTCRTKRAHG